MKTIKRLLWVLLGIVVLAVIGYFIYTAVQDAVFNFILTFKKVYVPVVYADADDVVCNFYKSIPNIAKILTNIYYGYFFL